MPTPFPGTVTAIIDDSGNPVAGALIYTYEAGTLTPKAAYTTSALNVTASNPIVCDAAGRATYFLGSGTYRVRVTMPLASGGAELTAYAEDNISGDTETITANLAASSGSSLVGHISAGTGAVARTVQSKLRDVVSVHDFGAVGDSVTDDSAAINLAITYCQDNDFILEFRANGRYRLGTSLVWKHGQSSSDPKKYHVRVRGNNATLFPLPGVTAVQVSPRCLLADAGTGRGEADIDISELYIDGALASTTGKALLIGAAGFRCSNFAWSQVDDVTVQNFTTPNAVAAIVEARHIAFNSCTIRTGTLNISCDTTGNFAGDLVFHACEFNGTATSRPFNITCGVFNGQVRGITFSACDFYGTGGLINSSGTSSQVGDIWFENGCQFDGPGSPAGEIPLTIQASGTSSRVYQVHSIGTYFVSYTGACVYAVSSGTATITQLSISGGGINTVTCNAGSGNAVFFFLQCESVSVRDVEFDTVSGTSAQYINLDGCTDVMIANNKARSGSGMAYGVTIGNTGTDRYSILGNQFSCSTGAVNDYTSGAPQRQLANNLLVA